MATTDETVVHDYDYDYGYRHHHHHHHWGGGIIAAIVGGSVLLLLVLCCLCLFGRRRRYGGYPAYPVRDPVAPGTRLDPSEAPEPTYVEGQHQEKPDYEAGRVEEHHHHHVQDPHYSPPYRVQHYPHQDDGYGGSGFGRQASP